MIRRVMFFPLLCAALLGFMGRAHADDYAYMITGESAFGVVDLNTGVFSKCGQMTGRLSGLGVGPELALYGGAYGSNTLYRIDVTNGGLTAVGTSSINFFLTGSTMSGLYAMGTDDKLYSMDTAGAATLIGTVGITGSWWAMSTNAKPLYLAARQTAASTLFQLNLRTGKAKLIGTAAEGVFGAAVKEHGVLYAGSDSPRAIYAVSATDGSATQVSSLSGNGVGSPWGFAPIKDRHITKRNMCVAHPL